MFVSQQLSRSALLRHCWEAVLEALETLQAQTDNSIICHKLCEIIEFWISKTRFKRVHRSISTIPTHIKWCRGRRFLKVNKSERLTESLSSNRIEMRTEMRTEINGKCKPSTFPSDWKVGPIRAASWIIILNILRWNGLRSMFKLLVMIYLNKIQSIRQSSITFPLTVLVSFVHKLKWEVRFLLLSINCMLSVSHIRRDSISIQNNIDIKPEIVMEYIASLWLLNSGSTE